MNNIVPLLQQLKTNPLQTLLAQRLNVPANIINDPTAILNHLLQTGQVSQDAVNRAYQMAQKLR